MGEVSVEARDGPRALPPCVNEDLQRMTHSCQCGGRICGPHDAGSCEAGRDDASTALDLALRSWRCVPGLVHVVASYTGMSICYAGCHSPAELVGSALP